MDSSFGTIHNAVHGRWLDVGETSNNLRSFRGPSEKNNASKSTLTSNLGNEMNHIAVPSTSKILPDESISSNATIQTIDSEITNKVKYNTGGKYVVPVSRRREAYKWLAKEKQIVSLILFNLMRLPPKFINITIAK